MQAQKAEGTRDLIGAEMRAWQKMQRIAAGVFEPFGFKPIETPAIEQVDVFVHGIGQSTDVVRKEMFRVFSGANLERVFTEGTDARILSAASKLLAGKILNVLLLGEPEAVKKAAADGGFDKLSEKYLAEEKTAFDELGFKWFFDLD